jgi:hypothetical protein
MIVAGPVSYGGHEIFYDFLPRRLLRVRFC